MIAARWILGASMATAIATLGHRGRALTGNGAIAAALVGTIVFAMGGLKAAAAEVAFFASSSLLSRIARVGKSNGRAVEQAKGSRRDAAQVLANGGVGALTLLLGGRSDRGPGAFLGATAAACADTWATELGTRFGGKPRLLTTLRPVPPGTSGGITPAGMLASCAGASAVGLAWVLIDRQHSARGLKHAAVAGTAGSLFDSLLGATLQAGYVCDECRVPTETRIHPRCGRATRHVKGLVWIDNDVVNAMATLFGAGVGAIVSMRRLR